MKEERKYMPLGEQVLIVQFEDILSIEVNQSIQAFAQLIKNQCINGIKEIIPAMTSLSIKYDPLTITFDQLKNNLEGLEELDGTKNSFTGKTVHIPIAFDRQNAPDLEYLSNQTGLDKEKIVEILISKPYYVYMIGFIAGLPYMGNIDERLALPRRETPRLKVPKGSVAIANQLTDIYTIESPGGWHIVGWTPMEIFDSVRNPPSLLFPGDYVKYERISADLAKEWSRTKQEEWDQTWNQ